MSTVHCGHPSCNTPATYTIMARNLEDDYRRMTAACGLHLSGQRRWAGPAGPPLVTRIDGASPPRATGWPMARRGAVPHPSAAPSSAARRDPEGRAPK